MKETTRASDGEQRIAKWLAVHKTEFYDALGLWPFEDPLMVKQLLKMREYFDGRFPMWKDDIDRMRCQTIMNYLHGEEVAADELRIALALLLQAYNAAVDRIYSLEEAERRRPKSPPPRPYPPRRVIGVR